MHILEQYILCIPKRCQYTSFFYHRLLFFTESGKEQSQEKLLGLLITLKVRWYTYWHPQKIYLIAY